MGFWLSVTGLHLENFHVMTAMDRGSAMLILGIWNLTLGSAVTVVQEFIKEKRILIHHV